jgi:23S rRNA maturation mini-RNase III
MLIDAILNLPNRYRIITKYGKIENLHKTANEWFKSEGNSVFINEFVIYIVREYSQLKTYK